MKSLMIWSKEKFIANKYFHLLVTLVATLMFAPAIEQGMKLEERTTKLATALIQLKEFHKSQLYPFPGPEDDPWDRAIIL